MASPFILRSAGFAARLMDGLNLQAAAQTTDAALAAETTLATLAAELTQSLRSTFASRRDSALRWKTVQKALAKGRAFEPMELEACADNPELQDRLVAWNAAVAAAAATHAQACSTFEAELEHARRALRVLVADPRFQEAVFLSSPHMYDAGLQHFLRSTHQPLRRAEDKRVERQLVMYLQRFCMKNETTSFFGPIGYGRFDADDKAAAMPSAWPVRWHQPVALGRCETFMAFWAVDALAQALARLPCVRATLRPQLDRSVRRVGPASIYIAAQCKTVALPPAWAAMLDRIEQGDTVAALTRDGTAVLDEMERKGLVRTAIPIPLAVTQTLEWLTRFVDGLPEHASLQPWRNGLLHLLETKQAFAAAGLEGRVQALGEAAAVFTSLTGLEAQREAGKIYADRSLYYEECRSGHQDLCVSREWSRHIEQCMGRLLNLFARDALERRACLQKLGVDIFRQLFGDTTTQVPFLHFVKQLLAAPQGAEWTEALRQFRSSVQQTLVAQVREAGAARRRVELAASVLDALCGDGDLLLDVPLLISPDLMLARQEDGQPLIVLGEVHDTLMVWGWALGFHEDNQALADDMRRFAAGLGLNHVLNLLSSNRRKIIPFEYPGRTVEFRAWAGAGNPTLLIADLNVVRTGDRLQLQTQGDTTPLSLHNGELPTLCHALFALPRCIPFAIDLGEHTPRISAAGMVLQRERWRLQRATSGLAATYPGTSFDLFVDMRRLRHRTGMPERVFLKSPSEPKPVFIDFRCHFLLEAWDTLFPADATVTVSEMLPDDQQLWLTDVHGDAVTSELRTAFGRPADLSLQPCHDPREQTHG